jgi:hypothetical protein
MGDRDHSSFTRAGSFVAELDCARHASIPLDAVVAIGPDLPP